MGNRCGILVTSRSQSVQAMRQDDDTPEEILDVMRLLSVETVTYKGVFYFAKHPHYGWDHQPRWIIYQAINTDLPIYRNDNVL